MFASSLCLVSDFLPVCAEDHLIVVAEIEEYTDGRAKPEADDAPIELEDCQQREGDADDPITDNCADGRNSLLPEASNHALADTLDAVNEYVGKHDWVGFSDNVKDLLFT